MFATFPGSDTGPSDLAADLDQALAVSTPKGRANSSLSGLPTSPVTVAPASLAIRVAISPTGPALVPVVGY